MSRSLDQLASLNAVPNDNSPDEQKHHEEELQMFSNTTFFDYDMGRSTDIATTVDELLMQQEKQIQYPQKQQPVEESGPIAGPSYSVSQQQPPAPQFAADLAQNELQQDQTPRNLPFDFSTLQGFSLAGELPQASLSIYDVDPIFHESAQPSQHQQQQQLQLQQNQNQNQHQHQNQHQNQHQLLDNELHYHQHSVAKPAIVQRHEVADNYASVKAKGKDESPQSQLEELSFESGGQDDEKRRRNTAASARFRIKKKMREQEMEKNHRMMQQRIADQEDRIKQLEMENSWLRNLVVEKNTARDSTSLGRLRQELLLKDGQR